MMASELPGGPSMPTPDDELIVLCRTILATGRSIEDWRERESDDEFQSPHYVGGYDATEDAFCFSYYDDDREEWWFQFSLEDVESLAPGDPLTLDLTAELSESTPPPILPPSLGAE